jgi:pyochelin biosynthesis protein PchC
MTGAWFRPFGRTPDARTVLVCCPHAGGSASFFRDWPSFFGPDVQVVGVQYPGRQDRLREPCVTEVPVLAEEIAKGLVAGESRPIALFGHSMGASVAHEVALLLPDRVTHLIVSGRPGPGRLRAETKHLLPDDELWAEVCGLGGVDQELASLPELRNLVLTTLRADYQASETYRPAPGPRLSCPVLACVGDNDPDVTEKEARAWAAATTGSFRLAVFPGRHFYLIDRRVELLGEVVAWLRRAAVSQP